MTKWTESQKAFTIKNYGPMSTKQIAEHIGKTYRAVKSFIRRNGLKMSPDDKRRHFVDAMDKLSEDGIFAGENNPNWKGGISAYHYHYKKIQEQRYPDRVRARKILAYHVKRGNIEKLSCQYGGCKDKNTHGHHEDYSKPLDVVWLCRKHHREIHGGTH